MFSAYSLQGSIYLDGAFPCTNDVHGSGVQHSSLAGAVGGGEKEWNVSVHSLETDTCSMVQRAS